MKPRLLIVTSHPIQYQAPWFRALHSDARLALSVLFLTLPDENDQGVGFGKPFSWDIPLREGYVSQLARSAVGRISDGFFGLRLQNARKDISSLNPDAVLILGWQHLGMLQCIRAASRLRLPVLIRAESNGLQRQSWLRSLKNRWILFAVTRVLPIGRANRAFYQQLKLGDRIGSSVPYFVDNAFFAKRSAEARKSIVKCQKALNVPADTFCFVFVGKFIEKKRPLDVLKALQRLLSISLRPIHLLMVGTGPFEEELKSYAHNQDLPVSFAGFLNQTQIPAAYAVAHCLVLPSDFGETWGLVVNEAMACGLPAIVSDRVGCGPDLVEEGKTGFRFAFGQVDKLAEKMKTMVECSEQQLHAMGSAAKERVESGFSIELAVKQTVQAVLEVSGAVRLEPPH